MNSKKDYQVVIKPNLGGMNILLVLDKAVKKTLIGISEKTISISNNQRLNNVVSDQEIEQLKKARLNNELKLNTAYELTDLLAQTC